MSATVEHDPVHYGYIGSPVRRTEDKRLVTGRGRFVDDATAPGMLAAAFVRSYLARGQIVSIDTAAARALPGVHAVWTGAELNGDAGEMYGTLYGPTLGQYRQRPLAIETVQFVGDPVVIVVADDRYIAEDACELVEVTYEPLPPILNIDDAINDTTNLVHPELGTNVAASVPLIETGDVSATIAAAAHVFTERIVQHRYAAVPMETSGLLATWDMVLGQLTVWMASQNAHEVRAYCSRLLDVPETRVRVISDDVGGAFGQKGGVSREATAVVLATRRLGLPVKWIEDRQENLVAGHHAREDAVDITMAMDDEGRLLATDMFHTENVGAYPLGGNGSIGRAVYSMVPGPYRLPEIRFQNKGVYTNTCGRCSYRGPWMFENVIRETMLDIAARGIGMDPLELRRRNILGADELPYTTVSGVSIHHVTPAESLERAVAKIGYDEFRETQAAARAEGRYLGIGMSVCVEPTAPAGRYLGHEVATVRMDKSGSVTVLAGTSAQGQGIETTMSQIVAEQLGVPIENISYVHNDTGTSPPGGGSGGSRVGVAGGGACHLAAGDLRDKILQIAAHMLEAAPEDLEIADSVVSVKGTPTKTIGLAEIATLSHLDPAALPPGMEAGLEVTRRYRVDGGTLANATHVCTCEVDITTGRVRFDRYIVSEDCGVMINPMVVEGQIAGGVIQGIGGVLYEHMPYDDNGTPQATTFMDYLLPTTTEVPIIEYDHVQSPSERLGGYKGVGEGGAVAAPAAIVNAIADALAPLGVKITRQPLGPSQLLDLSAAAAEAAPPA